MALPNPQPLHRARVIASPWPGLFGTEIDSGRCFGRHWHAVFGIGLLQRGAQCSASGRGRVEAFAGDLIASNPGELHDGQPLGASARRWRMLYLEPDLLAAHAGEALRGDVELSRPVMRDARLAQALQRLFAWQDRWAAQRQTTPVDALLALTGEEALAHALALLLAGHVAAPLRAESRAVPALSRVRDRLAADLAGPVPSLAELAAQAGLSRYQLLRHFEKAYGLPPHAWLLQQRVERARGLIRAGHALADAASAAGFADQAHLTRVFGGQHGFTPGDWRRACRLQ